MPPLQAMMNISGRRRHDLGADAVERRFALCAFAGGGIQTIRFPARRGFLRCSSGYKTHFPGSCPPCSRRDTLVHADAQGVFIHCADETCEVLPPESSLSVMPAGGAAHRRMRGRVRRAALPKVQIAYVSYQTPLSRYGEMRCGE